MSMALSDKQRGVLKGVAAGMALTLLGIFGAPWIDPAPRVVDPSARLSFALSWDLLLLICLIANVGALARHRFSTPEDIDGGGLSAGSPRAKVLQATLQNTLEQVVIASLVHLIWAVTMPLRWTASLPVAASLFVLGRLLFWRGYERGAPGRALGFALTFYPSVVMTLVLVVHRVYEMLFAG
ncbi:MAG: MAPEG family protein [Enhygromyxa sp.]